MTGGLAHPVLLQLATAAAHDEPAGSRRRLADFLAGGELAAAAVPAVDEDVALLEVGDPLLAVGPTRAHAAPLLDAAEPVLEAVARLLQVALLFRWKITRFEKRLYFKESLTSLRS